jgi:two-component system response regulator HydG
LLDYDFPGNEEELQALVERAVERCEGTRVGLSELARLLPAKPTGNPLDAPLETVERRALRRALDRAGGSKSEAARLLGIPRTTLIDKLRRHGIEPAPEARIRSSDRPGSA